MKKARQYLKQKGICFSTKITVGKIAKHMNSHAKEHTIKFLQRHYKSNGAVFTDKYTAELYNEFINQP